jgi:phosphohistidine phosphatase
MKVYLIHHCAALTVEQDPERHLSPLGCTQADRLGARFKAAGIAPARILHSDKQWTSETGARIAGVLGLEDRTAIAGYPVNTGDHVGPFIDEINNGDGDVMMTGHVDYLIRTASKMLCGDEAAQAVSFKPDFGTVFCLEGEGKDWTLKFGWRQEHEAG